MFKQKSAYLFAATNLFAVLFLFTGLFLSGCDTPAENTSKTNRTSATSDEDIASAETPSSDGPVARPKRNKIKSLGGGEDGPSRGFKEQ